VIYEHVFIFLIQSRIILPYTTRNTASDRPLTQDCSLSYLLGRGPIAYQDPDSDLLSQLSYHVSPNESQEGVGEGVANSSVAEISTA
jgi:hypothetical protein